MMTLPQNKSALMCKNLPSFFPVRNELLTSFFRAFRRDGSIGASSLWIEVDMSMLLTMLLVQPHVWAHSWKFHIWKILLIIVHRKPDWCQLRHGVRRWCLRLIYIKSIFRLWCHFNAIFIPVIVEKPIRFIIFGRDLVAFNIRDFSIGARERSHILWWKLGLAFLNNFHVWYSLRLAFHVLISIFSLELLQNLFELLFFIIRLLFKRVDINYVAAGFWLWTLLKYLVHEVQL